MKIYEDEKSQLIELTEKIILLKKMNKNIEKMTK